MCCFDAIDNSRALKELLPHGERAQTSSALGPAARPLSARAQQGQRFRRIGVLRSPTMGNGLSLTARLVVRMRQVWTPSSV